MLLLLRGLFAAASVLFSCLAPRVRAQEADSPAEQAPPASAPLHFRLRNGLTVRIEPDPQATQSCVLVRYAVGARDDPSGFRGIAHLTEHMTYRAGTTIERLEAIGATDFGGITSLDDTYYYAVVPPSATETLLWLEAHRMAFAVADMERKGFARERDVVLRELAEKGGLERELRWEMEGRIYPAKHPYTQHDDSRDLGHIRLSDVQWFTQAHYSPERAQLVILGRVDAQQVKAWVERYFGPIARTQVSIARTTVPPATSLSAEAVELRTPVVHELLSIIWVAPGWGSASLPALEAASVLLQDHLQSELVEDAGPASFVSVSVEDRELDSHLSVSIGARDNHKALDFLPVVDRFLSALRAGNIPAEELADAKRRLQRRAARRRYDMSERALELARTLTQPVKDGPFPELDLSMVQKAALTWLQPKMRVVGVVRP